MRIGTVVLLCTAELVMAFSTPVIHSQRPASNPPRVIAGEGDVEGVHDPSITKEGGTWHLFGTATESKRNGELPVRCLPDLHHWSRCGHVLPVRIYEIERLGDTAPAVTIVNSIAGARTIESSAGRLAVELTGADEQAAALLRALVVGNVNVIRFDHGTLGLEARYRMVFRESR